MSSGMILTFMFEVKIFNKRACMDVPGINKLLFQNDSLKNLFKQKNILHETFENAIDVEIQEDFVESEISG